MRIVNICLSILVGAGVSMHLDCIILYKTLQK